MLDSVEDPADPRQLRGPVEDPAPRILGVAANAFGHVQSLSLPVRQVLSLILSNDRLVEEDGRRIPDRTSPSTSLVTRLGLRNRGLWALFASLVRFSQA